MNEFTNKDIADYYNQTLNHYQRWWHLDKSLAVHYGFWDKDTKTFHKALENTNRYLLQIADVKLNERILDAGCGVGGSCFFLAKERKAKVTGISLSEKQIEFAKQKAIALHLTEFVDFKIEDYSNTSYKEKTFDLIWAIESITSAPDKANFSNEAYRILKPGGRLIIADYFRNNGNNMDQSGLLEKWRKNWSMAPFLTLDEYKMLFEKSGLIIAEEKDVTGLIFKTSKKMYQSSLLGAIPSKIYNFFNNPSHFAKDHYKSGFYQYQALKRGLWNYHVLLFRKDNE